VPTLEVTLEQVLGLVRQLSPEGKYTIFHTLHMEGDGWWSVLATNGEEYMRYLASERDADWDTMSESDREAFIDQLIHEERQCLTTV
jgi:hypothetical protein